MIILLNVLGSSCYAAIIVSQCDTFLFLQLSSGGRPPQQQQGDHPGMWWGSRAHRILGTSQQEGQESIWLHVARSGNQTAQKLIWFFSVRDSYSVMNWCAWVNVMSTFDPQIQGGLTSHHVSTSWAAAQESLLLWSFSTRQETPRKSTPCLSCRRTFMQLHSQVHACIRLTVCVKISYLRELMSNHLSTLSSLWKCQKVSLACFISLTSRSVPGGQPPRGISVAGLVASERRKHRLSTNPLGLGQEVRHGDCAAVL